MKEARENRFKTVCIDKFQFGKRKQRAGTSNPYRFIHKNQNNEQGKQIKLKKPLNQSPDSPYNNRESGKLNLIGAKNKYNQKSYLDSLKQQARVELQKLCLKQKLIQVQHIFKNTRQLCKKYGYFIITYAMLKFQYDQPIKISVWIHPDNRSQKPLHPIKKSTQFQCQLQCVSQLKAIVKFLFPTVDLGDSKTFGNIIAHLNNAKTQYDNKFKKNPQPQSQTQLIKKDSLKSPTSHQNNSNQRKQNFLLISSKTIPTFNHQRLDDDLADENSRKTFKNNNIKNKQGSSTLVQSVRSAYSIRENIKQLLSQAQKQKSEKQKTLKQHQLKQKPQNKIRKSSFSQPCKLSQSSSHHEQPPTIFQKKNLVQVASPCQQQRDKVRKSSLKVSSTKNHLKSSMSGKRLMSMSIEIQSEIDNLFGADQMKTSSNFYNRNSDMKNLKNSILSKVAEEFQDIF